MDITIVESDHVDASGRVALLDLWHRAFGDRFSEEDADHAFGGVHVLVRDGGHLVGHASAIPRRMKFGDQAWRTVGYVEAVATDPDRQGEGIGRRAMQALHPEIARRWPVALLSTGRAKGFYERLGWEQWGGLSYTRTAHGVVPDGEEGGLMVLRLEPSAVPDLTVTVTCEERPGDAW